MEPLIIEALKNNETRIKAKLAALGEAPEHARSVTRLKVHLSEVQKELKKASPTKTK